MLFLDLNDRLVTYAKKLFVELCITLVQEIRVHAHWTLPASAESGGYIKCYWSCGS